MADLVIGKIAAFIGEDNQRVDSPVIRTASDGRTYIVCVVQTPCPQGVVDFSDGEAKALYAKSEQLNVLAIGDKVRV